MGEVGMKRAWLIATTVAALAGCASKPEPPPPSPPPPPPPPPPAVTLPVAPVSVPAPPPPDQCGAYELASLVGKPRSEIPVPVNPSRRRVVCATCPKTMDFSPTRLTIEYDAGTGRVTKVACG
jgi:hypothetical protein